MSELLHYLTPTPANIPIVTRGNTLCRDGERFLIKGISYIPRKAGIDPSSREAMLDPSTDNRLDDLKQDIVLLRELGLNTVSVQALNLSNDHSKAMSLLEHAGIYVLATICDNIKAPKAMAAVYNANINPDFDTAPHLLTKTFTLLDQLAPHPNLLGFTLSSTSIHTPAQTKFPKVLRARIRETKHLLSLHKQRQRPASPRRSLRKHT